MMSILETLKANGLSEFLCDRAADFMDTGDVSIPRKISSIPADWQISFVGKSLVDDVPWTDEARKILRFFIHLSDGAAPTDDTNHEFLFGVLRHLHSDDYQGDCAQAMEIVEEIESNHVALSCYVSWHLEKYAYSNNWKIGGDPSSSKPFVSPVANLLFNHLSEEVERTPEILNRHGEIFAVLAIQRPELTRAWCINSPRIDDSWSLVSSWCEILDASPAYDELFLSCCEELKASDPSALFRIMRHFYQTRGEEHLDKLLEIAAIPEAALGHESLELLIEHRRDKLLPIMVRAFSHPEAGMHISEHDGSAYMKLYELMFAEWSRRGCELLPLVIEKINSYWFSKLLSEILPKLDSEHFPALRDGFLRRVAKTESRERAELWKIVASLYPDAVASDLEELLGDKSKPLREIAARALSESRGKDFIPLAAEMLGNKSSNVRHGGALFFEALADSTTIPMLLTALETEKTNEVRDALHRALQACGTETKPCIENMNDQNFDPETFTANLSKGLKMPKSQWLDLKNLPPLHFLNGSHFSENSITLLIAKQSQQKNITAAPDILPLLAHIDREKSAPFAAALVEGFLNSEQAASDRWALTLGGLLGDNRIIPMLLSRIQGWCENSRHKLAEYAAQAISLLPGNEPLMVLDTLANRYRTKFKNIGAACSAAFNAAATARGISSDELGDMVVPTFGFDADGIRRFDWEGGGISAELGPDFKLSWFDPDTDKSWKTLPANATEDIKTEVKTVTKLIRETLKAQTARLEMSFVRQRQWPVARWRELFENHPFLRSFASGLIWGVYDVSGNLLRTFRRYSNGILADASGAVEELTETDTDIAMVHPLDLDQTTVSQWQAHLSRMKVKQPFSQIDRPIERMDPLHANRKSISLTEGSKLSAGTFKSRAEKRGWTRGSVVDAGGISSYYKLYPGAGVEVILPTDNFWVGIDPMDEVVLGAAYFAKSGTIERGGYVYDEPAPNDPRVLRFDQVPPVVFSETLADLKAIIVKKP